MKVYVLFGCEYHSADYTLGVYSTIEKAVEKASHIMNDEEMGYDELVVLETTIDSMDESSYSRWAKVWTNHQ